MKKIGVRAPTRTVIPDMTMSQDNSHVAAVKEGAAHLWPLDMRRELLQIPKVRCLSFMSGGERLMTVAEQEVAIWRTEDAEKIDSWGPLPGPIQQIAVSPCGKLLAVSSFREEGGDFGIYVARNHGISVWSVDYHACFGTLVRQSSRATPYDDLLDALHSQKRLIDPQASFERSRQDAGPQPVGQSADEDKRQERSNAGPIRPILGQRLRFSPAGERILVLEPEFVSAWQSSALSEDRRWACDDNPTCFDLSPDGRMVAIGYVSGALRVWNAVLDGPPLVTLRAGNGPVRCCTFSPDGQFLEGLSQSPTSEGGNVKMPEADDGLVVWSVIEEFKPLWSSRAGYRAEKRAISGVTFSGFIAGGTLIGQLDGDGHLTIVDFLRDEVVYRWNSWDQILWFADAPNDGLVMARTLLDKLLVLSLEQRELPPPVVTAARLWDVELAYSGTDVVADCSWCGRRFSLDRHHQQGIESISSGVGSGTPIPTVLPDEAWRTPGLLSACPLCSRPLRFNPFIAEVAAS